MTESRVYRAFPGGMVSPQDLRRLCWEALGQGATELALGSRQDFWWKVDTSEPSRVSDEGRPARIISSLWASEILPGAAWFNPGLLHEFLRQLQNRQLRLNLDFLDQTSLAYHPERADLRFIAGEVPHSWSLLITRPDKSWLWPLRIESSDIPALLQELEKDLGSGDDGRKTWSGLSENFVVAGFPAPEIPQFSGLAWESWLAQESGTWTFAVYRRAGKFQVKLLQEIADRAEEQELPYLHLSPWRSIFIKSIIPKNKKTWDSLMKIHGVCTRHSSPEWVLYRAEDDERGAEVRDKLIGHWSGVDFRCEDTCFCLLSERGELWRYDPGFNKIVVFSEASDLVRFSSEVLPVPPEELVRLAQLKDEDDGRLRPIDEPVGLSLQGQVPANAVLAWRCKECLTRSLEMDVQRTPFDGDKIEFLSSEPVNRGPTKTEDSPETPACLCCGARNYEVFYTKFSW